MASCGSNEGPRKATLGNRARVYAMLCDQWEPVTTSMVALELAMAYRTARLHLIALADEGRALQVGTKPAIWVAL